MLSKRNWMDQIQQDDFRILYVYCIVFRISKLKFAILNHLSTWFDKFRPCNASLWVKVGSISLTQQSNTTPLQNAATADRLIVYYYSIILVSALSQGNIHILLLTNYYLYNFFNEAVQAKYCD